MFLQGKISASYHIKFQRSTHTKPFSQVAMADSPYTGKCGTLTTRIMQLEPGEGQDPLACNLIEETLSTALAFEALSYEWKKEGGFTSIRCNGFSLEITCKFADALKALRLPCNP